ncbi:MAG: SOS response-associated peptidase [Betaproteobacteria bacterium]
MCGRFVSPAEAAIERAWHVGRGTSTPFARRYNVAPTATIPVLRWDRQARQLELVAARWGLIPHWWKELKAPQFAFNARIEEAASKPMWRDASRRARCLIPAEGWYEWKEDVDGPRARTRKQPYFVCRPDRQPFCFAGLLSRWLDRETGETVVSCAILTTPAAGALAELHERMPVVVPDTVHGAWLDAAQTDAEQALGRVAAAAPATIDLLEHYAVSARVNDARIDEPALLQPLGAREI